MVVVVKSRVDAGQSRRLYSGKGREQSRGLKGLLSAESRAKDYGGLRLRKDGQWPVDSIGVV